MNEEKKDIKREAEKIMSKKNEPKKITQFIKKIRYKAIAILLKYTSPHLYYKLGLLDLIGNGLDIPQFCATNNTPRPAIKVMKRYFGDSWINGAEIGVNQGVNAKSILKELNIKKLFLIDSWDKDKTYQYNEVENLDIAYKKVLERFKHNEKIEIIRDFSSIAVKRFEDNSLDFVYIDANHEYNYVYQDIELWSKKVKNKGIIAGHDIFNITDVLKAVKDWCSKNRTRFYVHLPDWYFIKEEDLDV